jgi:hypothetical protein
MAAGKNVYSSHLNDPSILKKNYLIIFVTKVFI